MYISRWFHENQDGFRIPYKDRSRLEIQKGVLGDKCSLQ